MVNRAIFLVVVAQFCCTSLWFATNGVLNEVSVALGIEAGAGLLTSSVQLGFISGTLVFAVLKLADRFSPSQVFMICALTGAFFNGSTGWIDDPLWFIFFRFLTGFSLAGIYPVGMKIASDHSRGGLGLALGYLVGALVLGTALPHLTGNLLNDLSWESVILASSALSVIGGLVVGFGVPDGPYRLPTPSFDPSAFFRLFGEKGFRGAAIGYFGHMWELYAFWAFLPFYLTLYSGESQNGALWSFLIIASGGVGCVFGGYLSRQRGSRFVAGTALSISMICCILSPLALHLPEPLFYVFMFVWGMAVVADSPQFSTLVALAAPAHLTATGLTIVNSIGFAVTIASIFILDHTGIHDYMFLWLVPGPVFGLFFLFNNVKKNACND